MTGADDFDEDGFEDDFDNCPSVANPDQLDSDPGTFGDACDVDADNDLVSDSFDLYPDKIMDDSGCATGGAAGSALGVGLLLGLRALRPRRRV